MRRKTVITKLLQRVTEVYYKVRQVLQNASSITNCNRLLLQTVSDITNCDKLLLQTVSAITNCDTLLLQTMSAVTKYDRLLLQSASSITKWDLQGTLKEYWCIYILVRLKISNTNIIHNLFLTFNRVLRDVTDCLQIIFFLTVHICYFWFQLLLS